MRFSASVLRSTCVLLAGLVFAGCTPSAQTQSDEEREPHFLAGKSRVSSMDYTGAIESFEKALESNPQSAAAHFELACLFDEKEMDPAAAIYHYDHYLKLRPNAENADVVRQRILTCKQDLARTVVLGPVTEKVQKEMDQVTQENKRLAEDNKRLRDDLDKWIAYASQLQRLTNQASAVGRAGMAFAGTTSPQNAGVVSRDKEPANERKPALALGSMSRTHTIKPGETPIIIARKYRIKLEALMAANPKVDARRLQVGQSLVIPTS